MSLNFPYYTFNEFTFDWFYNAATEKDFADIIEKCADRMPELAALKRHNQCAAHHPEGITPFEHTLAALRDYKGNDPVVKLALLFHDIGKPIVAKKSENGDYYNFKEHDKAGVVVFDTLPFTGWIHEIIKFAISNHMRFFKITDMKESKVIKLVENSYNFEVLSRVAYHDIHCRGELSNSNKPFEPNYKRALKVMEEKQFNSYTQYNEWYYKGER